MRTSTKVGWLLAAFVALATSISPDHRAVAQSAPAAPTEQAQKSESSPPVWQPPAEIRDRPASIAAPDSSKPQQPVAYSDWVNNVVDVSTVGSFFNSLISIGWGILQIGLIILVPIMLMRAMQGRMGGLGGMTMGGPGGMGGMGTHFDANAPEGAPAGADLSFLTIIKPADNPVRLASVILDKGLKKKLGKIAASLAEKKRLYEEARAALVAEEEARAKKTNSWSKDSSPVKVDMSKAKIKKPKEGLFRSKPGKAFLFTGGPGTGKTLTATAIAGTAGVPILVISGTLENTLLGGGAQRVDIVMSIAAKLGPCLIFVDEAENAAGQRDKGGQKMGATSDSTTAKWLAAIDGVRQKVDKDSEFMGAGDWIYFAMATNYADMMDEAIKRAGRLKVLNFTNPTVPLLQKMLQRFIGKKKLPLASDMDTTFLAAATMLSGKTGADIEEIANSFAEYCEEEAQRVASKLEKAGKSEQEVQAAVESLRFGQQAFLFGVIDHLMGAKIEDDTTDFNRDLNTTLHELFHALAGAVAGRLGLSADRMRLLCVSRRQRSLGVCFWSPAKGDRTNLSKRDVLGLTMIGYAGGAVQSLINFFKTGLGREFDFFSDSGAAQDLTMSANLIKDNVALHHGSLSVGPISKGNYGRTHITEMGDDMVNEVDLVIRARQRLGYAIAHWICSTLISSPIVWEMAEEVLISRDNLMVEDRFYEYFDRLMGDERIRLAIDEELPKFIRTESDKATSDPKTYVWVPQAPSPQVCDFIRQRIEQLEPKYAELQLLLEAEANDDADAGDAGEGFGKSAAAEASSGEQANKGAEAKAEAPVLHQLGIVAANGAFQFLVFAWRQVSRLLARRARQGQPQQRNQARH